MCDSKIPNIGTLLGGNNRPSKARRTTGRFTGLSRTRGTGTRYEFKESARLSIVQTAAQFSIPPYQ